MKGIVLAGGLGSRLYPLTLSISKHLLPVYDKPLIFYPISVLMLAGIKDILIICNPIHLEQYKTLLGNGDKYGISLNYEIQEEPKGICNALLVGKDFIGKDDFSLILGDNIFYGPGMTHLLKKSINNNLLGATVFTYHVPDQSKFGVINYSKNGKIGNIVEKPKGEKPGSAVTGLYLFKNEAMMFCKEIKPSKRGECEITSLLNIYAKNDILLEQKLGRGFVWFDAGSFETLIEVSNFVRSIEKRHGYKIACLEEIALGNGWLNKKIDKNNNLFKIHNEYYSYVRGLY